MPFWASSRIVGSTDGRRTPGKMSKQPLDSQYLLRTGKVNGIFWLPGRRKLHVNDIPPEVVARIYFYLDAGSDRNAFMLSQSSWFYVAVASEWFRPAIVSKKQLLSICRTLQDPHSTFVYGAIVRRLNLTSVAHLVTDDILAQFSSCNNLNRLVLTGAVDLSAKALASLISSNPKLLSVDLCNIPAVNDEVLEALSKCTDLQGVYLFGCSKITDAGIIKLSQCQALKRIRLGGCQRITEVGIHAILETCHNMTELDVTNCAQPNLHLLPTPPEDEESSANDNNPGIDLAAGPAITINRDDIGYEAQQQALARVDFVNGTTDVSHDAGGMSDPLVRHILLMRRQLRELRIGSSPRITSAAFALPSSVRLNALRLIDLTACSQVTDTVVEQIVSFAPRLHNIVLAKCSSITDRSLISLTKLGLGLHYLHLGHCYNVTDRGILALVRDCQRLQYIDIANCTRLTNFAVEALATLPRLRRIGLVKCMQITDAAIRAIARRQALENTLERVHLSYCTQLTRSAIHELVNACPRLIHLSLTGVPDFFLTELTQFCREPPADLNDHQQSVFCVYSGYGVHLLREYLNSMSMGENIDQNQAPAITRQNTFAEAILVEAMDLVAARARETLAQEQRLAGASAGNPSPMDVSPEIYRRDLEQVFENLQHRVNGTDVQDSQERIRIALEQVPTLRHAMLSFRRTLTGPPGASYRSAVWSDLRGAAHAAPTSAMAASSVTIPSTGRTTPIHGAPTANRSNPSPTMSPPSNNVPHSPQSRFMQRN